MNLRSLIVMVQIKASCFGIFISWKQVQMKDAVASMRMLAISDTVSLSGAEMMINHVLIKARDKLIKHQVISFNEAGNKLPEQHYSFQQSNKDRLPPAVYNADNFAQIDG